MSLHEIREPADLRALSYADLDELAGEIRDFVVQSVAETGGHLGSNLGAVELTLALHRVFESPRDAILWDTGHQAYVHKLVTGRRAGPHPRGGAPPPRRLRRAAPGRGALGLPVARGEPPRLRREQPRLDDPV